MIKIVSLGCVQSVKFTGWLPMRSSQEKSCHMDEYGQFKRELRTSGFITRF
jgi:hypothetical protein